MGYDVDPNINTVGDGGCGDAAEHAIGDGDVDVDVDVGVDDVVVDDDEDEDEDEDDGLSL